MTKLLGDKEIFKPTLELLRNAGGTWAAYQNVALDSAGLGHLKFLRYGEGCTFAEPPKLRLPDTQTEINWKYYFVGLVDLERGIIVE